MTFSISGNTQSSTYRDLRPNVVGAMRHNRHVRKMGSPTMPFYVKHHVLDVQNLVECCEITRKKAIEWGEHYPQWAAAWLNQKENQIIREVEPGEEKTSALKYLITAQHELYLHQRLISPNLENEG
jgi:hypothetical protein